jgi:hypothetical protein
VFEGVWGGEGAVGKLDYARAEAPCHFTNKVLTPDP